MATKINNITVRLVRPADAQPLLHIYRPFVEKSPATFETTVPSVQEFATRIETYTQKYPWLVAEVGGAVAGYAYASKHRQREAYQWSVETSVYVHPEFYRQGVAKLLYHKLFWLLKQQGFVNVYAVVALPNEASIQLHKSCGFEHFCVYRQIGYKLGRWHDVMWMVKYINEHVENPAPPKGMGSVMHLLHQ